VGTLSKLYQRPDRRVARLALLVVISIWQMAKLNGNLMLISLAAAPVLLAIAAVYSLQWRNSSKSLKTMNQK
jgi:hypothetical protein